MSAFGNFIRDLFNMAPKKEEAHDPGSMLFSSTNESISASRRRTERHQTRHANVVWVTVGGRHRINVQNVSYGGLALQCEISQLKPYFSEDGVVDIVLHVYHMTIPCRINTLYEGAKSVGCAFVHDDEKTLLFLRKSLEFFRIGSSMMLLPKEIVKVEYKNPEFACYHGTPATELMVCYETKQHEKVKSLVMTFRDGATSCSLTYDGKKFNWQRMDGRQENDPLPLEQAFFIIMGFYEKQDLAPFSQVLVAFERELDRFYPQQKLSSVI